MLPRLHGRTLTLFGFNLRFSFFTRTRRKAYGRSRRLIITIRSSACSTAARVTNQSASARSHR